MRPRSEGTCAGAPPARATCSPTNDALSRRLGELSAADREAVLRGPAGSRGAGREASRAAGAAAGGREGTMSRVSASGPTFSALSVPNYRRFFFGQSVSLIGTWMVTVAESWLVYTLTHSATALGSCRWLP